jgi:hypothetical protein
MVATNDTEYEFYPLDTLFPETAMNFLVREEVEIDLQLSNWRIAAVLPFDMPIATSYLYIIQREEAVEGQACGYYYGTYQPDNGIDYVDWAECANLSRSIHF